MSTQTRYIKVYTAKEYRDALERLHEEGCTWSDGLSLLNRRISFGYPHALVVGPDKRVCKDEIRHCPDPSDRRLEATHLKAGDKVVLTDRYAEAKSHKGEVFEIVELKMIGQTPCAFLKPEGLGAYCCDGLKRVD